MAALRTLVLPKMTNQQKADSAHGVICAHQWPFLMKELVLKCVKLECVWKAILTGHWKVGTAPMPAPH